MNIGNSYKHAKGGTYMLMGFCKVKNDKTREWEDGVIYASNPLKPTGENPLYVRSKTDFAARFTEVRS